MNYFRLMIFSKRREMAKKYNLEIEQGTSFSNTITITGITNLDTYTGSGQIRKHPTSNTYYSFAVTLSVNTATIEMAANVTSTMASGLYLYDIEATNGNIVKRILAGMVIVTPGITQ